MAANNAASFGNADFSLTISVRSPFGPWAETPARCSAARHGKAGAKATEKCQQTMKKVGGTSVAKALKSTNKCTQAVLKCVQLKPDDEKCVDVEFSHCGEGSVEFVGRACFQKVKRQPERLRIGFHFVQYERVARNLASEAINEPSAVAVPLIALAGHYAQQARVRSQQLGKMSR